jgi:hypothetical protein
MQLLLRKVQVLLFAAPRTATLAAVRGSVYGCRVVLGIVIALFHRGQDLVERQRHERRGVVGYSVRDNELPVHRTNSSL